MGQASAVGGPYASVHIKTPQCHWRCPVMRGGSPKLKLYWAHYFKWQQSVRKFPLKVSDQQCFSHQMNAAPSAPTLSVFLSARVTDRCQNTGAQFCSPSRNLCSAQHAQPRKRKERDFFFSLLIIMILSFRLLQTLSDLRDNITSSLYESITSAVIFSAMVYSLDKPQHTFIC